MTPFNSVDKVYKPGGEQNFLLPSPSPSCSNFKEFKQIQKIPCTLLSCLHLKQTCPPLHLDLRAFRPLGCTSGTSPPSAVIPQSPARSPSRYIQTNRQGSSSSHRTTRHHLHHHQTPAQYECPHPSSTYPSPSLTPPGVPHPHPISVPLSTIPLTDASSSNWPTKFTKTRFGVYGMAGIFRIDDKDANARCSLPEKKRRTRVLGGVYRTLGQGLGGVKKAIRDGRPLRKSQPRMGSKKIAHFAAGFDKEAPPIRSLPDGYGIFQACDAKASRYDTYICGSIQGVQFRSAAEFILHLDWVLKGCSEARPCQCFYCGK